MQDACNTRFDGGLAMQRGVVDTQLIAHDKEVYDIAWGGVGVFASVSADGSVRVFDLRCVRAASKPPPPWD